MHKSFCTFNHRACIGIYWIAGLFLGVLSAADADSAVLSMMLLAPYRQVSIVCIFIRCILPFLLAAFAVLIQHSFILYIVVFLRCFCCGFLLWLTASAFGGAAWLIGPMLHFSDWLCLSLFLGFLLRWHNQLIEPLRWKLVLCLFLTAIIAMIDYFVVSPFLAELLES